ncbi:MAG: hypothetical protein QM754_18210 [Tepidisphaeraceae bacterium]
MQATNPLTINDKTTVTVEARKFLRLHLEHKTVYPSHLKDLGALLVAKGVLRPWEVQQGQDARKLIAERLDPFVRIHEANPQKPMSLSFGQGEFVLTWNVSGGDWGLLNPRNTVAPIATNPGFVGFFPNAESGVWKALERILLSREGALDYAEIDREVLKIAERIVEDVKVVKGK